MNKYEKAQKQYQKELEELENLETQEQDADIEEAVNKAGIKIIRSTATYEQLQELSGADADL